MCLFSWGVRGAIATRDEADDDVDFELVTTYTPLLLVLLRSAGLLVLSEVSVRVLGVRQNVLVVLVVLVYCDALYWRNDKLNRAAGFLCPVALAVLAGTEVTLCSPGASRPPAVLALLSYWTVQVVWPLGSAYYLAALAFGLYLPGERQVVVASVACLGVHCVLLLAGPQGVGEVMLRAVLYYTTTMLFYYSKARLSGVDRNTHSRLTVHVGMHLLFVDVYVLAGSAVVFGLLLWRVFCRSTLPGPALRTFGAPAKVAGPAPKTAGPAMHSAGDDALAQLRAAQAMRQA